MSLTGKVRERTKVSMLTVLVSFKSGASIILFSVTLTSHALSVIPIMPVHVPPSIFLELKCLDELTNCGSTSRGVNKSSEISGDVLIGESQLIFNAINIGRFSMA